jgi:hypothetical protein
MSNHKVTPTLDASFFKNKFQIAANQLDMHLLEKLQVEVAIVEILDCVVIKLYKRAWANPGTDALTSTTRIFFSIWADDSSMADQEISYNIHAFKLRHLAGYSIESRKFADAFRAKFKKYEAQWKNVSVQFGPLTLMEGRQSVNMENLQDDVLELLNNFLKIEHLVDETLLEFKK